MSLLRPRPTTRRLAVLVSAVALAASTLLLPAPVQAGPPGTWSRVLENVAATGRSIASARGDDGRLHVVAVGDTSGGKRLTHVTIDRQGRAVLGSESVIVSGWDAIASTVQLLPQPGNGLIAYWVGNDPDVAGVNAIWSASSADGGLTWGAVSSAFGDTVPNGTDTLSVVATPGGSSRAGYSDASTVFVDGPAQMPSSFASPCGACIDNVTLTALADESVDLTYTLNGGAPGTTGTFTRNVAFWVSDPIKAPSSSVGGAASGNQQAVPAVVRGSSVVRAYCVGYPDCDYVGLWAGGTKVVKVPGSADARNIMLAVDAPGRLWVAWVGSDRIVRAVRTSRTGFTFGALRRLQALPETVDPIGGDAQPTRLDLLAVTDGNVFHQQVLPGLTLRVSPRSFDGDRRTRVTARATDAGAPVAGVRISARGARCTTAANGKCTLTFAPRGPGRLRVSATKAGDYAPATATLRVRS
ncbi:hypothetical protein [Nocardioides sp.]|uniref:hypothetical protein n=1 Tax=Nocardioides sp. TaxID=35761 RepID=UPI003517A923